MKEPKYRIGDEVRSNSFMGIGSIIAVIHDATETKYNVKSPFGQTICNEGELNMVSSKVDHPSHYNQGNIECIDAMIAAYGKEEVATFCKINAFKYLWRLGRKDEPAQELAKAQWYLNKYNELITADNGKERTNKG